MQAHEIFRAQGPAKDVERLRSKLRGVEEQIEALTLNICRRFPRLSRSPSTTSCNALRDLKTQGQVELEEILRSGYRSEPPVQLREYKAYLTGAKDRRT